MHYIGTYILCVLSMKAIDALYCVNMLLCYIRSPDMALCEWESVEDIHCHLLHWNTDLRILAIHAIPGN